MNSRSSRSPSAEVREARAEFGHFLAGNTASMLGAAPTRITTEPNGAARVTARTRYVESGRLLLVAADPERCRAIERRLVVDGFAVVCAEDGDEALDLFGTDDFDCVVLDLDISGLSGLEVCRRLRAASDVLIVAYASDGGDGMCVLALEIGADEFVAEPFSLPDLTARIRALQRRRRLDTLARETIRRVGSLELDLHGHDATLDGRPLRLTPSEFRLLRLLSDEPERVYTRTEITRTLWESDFVGDARACDLHVARLRRKIESDPSRPERLVTVRGVGYRLRPV